jgi:hypothetical protein
MGQRRPRSPYLPETGLPNGLLLTRDSSSTDLAEGGGHEDGSSGDEDRRDALSARTAPAGAWACAAWSSVNEMVVSLTIFANVLDSKHDGSRIRGDADAPPSPGLRSGGLSSEVRR